MTFFHMYLFHSSGMYRCVNTSTPKFHTFGKVIKSQRAGLTEMSNRKTDVLATILFFSFNIFSTVERSMLDSSISLLEKSVLCSPHQCPPTLSPHFLSPSPFSIWHITPIDRQLDSFLLRPLPPFPLLYPISPLTFSTPTVGTVLYMHLSTHLQ